MRPYNEIRLATSHRADVLIGAACGAILAALVVSDVLQRITEWFAG